MNQQQLSITLLVALLSFGAMSLAHAQDPLLVETDLRGFSGREGLVYAGLTLQRASWVVRGVAANKAISSPLGETPVLHGGGDIELARRFTLKDGWRAEVGGAFSDTAAQPKRLHLTARASYSQSRTERLSVSLEPRGVFGNTSLIGLGFGAQVKLGAESALVGSVTPILSGHNAPGARSRTTLWELGLTTVEKKQDGMTVTLAWTNTLGTSTGFSLSPTIGDNALVWKVRFSR